MTVSDSQTDRHIDSECVRESERERVRERQRQRETVCVCVREREQGRLMVSF